MDDFLGRWREGKRLNRLSKRAIRTDRYDEADLNRIREEMAGFEAAQEALSEVAPTGNNLMADGFMSFMKTRPELLDSDDIRPTFLVNRKVIEESMTLPEYDKYRALTPRGDDVAAAMAAITMEPEYETLYDKLAKERELAERLEQAMAQAEALADEERSVDDMLEDLDDEAQREELEQRKQDLADQQEQLQEQIDAQAQDLQDKLSDAGTAIRAQLRSALNRAADEAEGLSTSGNAWGLEPGALHRLPADKRVELARKFNSPRLRAIADLFGSLQRVFFTEQLRKVEWAKEESFDIELGDDISQVLATEYLMLEDELLELDFLRRYADRALLQFKMRGQEKVGKGGIIVCEDSSGSMSGERELWAKAVSLCFLHAAKRQRRQFHGIRFGSPGQFTQHSFPRPEDFTPEAIIEWAEEHWGGGTCFMTPLNEARELLRAEFDQFGHTKGDIVFITDGECNVHPQWLEEFKADQEKLGFRVFGVLIGGGRYGKQGEPLWSICDGRVMTPADMRGADTDLRTLFRDF